MLGDSQCSSCDLGDQQKAILFPTKLKTEKVKTTIVAKSAPFHIDDNLFWIVTVTIPSLYMIQIFNITSVRTSAKNETDSSVLIVVGRCHQSANCVINQGQNFNFYILIK
ncbi:hypothetical protein BpHYR1_045339 [Brachionus plicatilis]|uniref:Uncharacterized protein n=1 Tax=Brachionus plicatilis TaxID=10195 RepID=A0A3M7SRD5_BRAPC|nr:hypothetical protein BpHYR1_045339 [Brachionus plicatilis]